eukprot:TRINITY_DN67517_c2_g7_i2.p2 TRINITY_DN67517_c2_g7~~TRINITY_DN67517_c2_g7_i2.p2  ORF type:complete len:186 (-),score=5.70 TRINITY_DN67517_c2_g7_i2:130-687(-)
MVNASRSAAKAGQKSQKEKLGATAPAESKETRAPETAAYSVKPQKAQSQPAKPTVNGNTTWAVIVRGSPFPCPHCRTGLRCVMVKSFSPTQLLKRILSSARRNAGSIGSAATSSLEKKFTQRAWDMSSVQEDPYHRKNTWYYALPPTSEYSASQVPEKWETKEWSCSLIVAVGALGPFVEHDVFR